MTDLLDAALAYAGGGLRVFPCKPNRSPLIAGGHNSASTDPETIRAWWTKWPNAWIGLATGPASGVAVLDLDMKNGKDGFAAVPGWEGLSSVIARTPNGGAHLYFKSDGAPDCTSDTIALGVDTRGKGGYAIVPPSPGYSWLNGSLLDAELAVWPDHLKLPERQPKRRPEDEPLPDYLKELLGRGDDGKGLSDDPDDVFPPTTVEEIEAALAVIPSENYLVWFRVGCALHNKLGDDGWLLFDAWSKKSTDKYQANECRKKWKDCIKFDTKHGELRVGTIFYYAYEADPTWRERVDTAKSDDPPERAKAKPYVLVRADTITPRSINWLWEGHLQRGALELLTGIPGLGKSQLQIDLVAAATTGRAWPNGAPGGEPVDVIMVTAEDALDQVVLPRLIAAGADRKRVHILKTIRKDKKDRMFLLAEDLAELDQAIRDTGNVGLMTLDPITAYMGSKVDSNRTTDVRGQLGPLAMLAEATDVAISAVTHPAKAASARAIDHFIGSQAFIAAARIGHLCIEEVADDKTPTGRVLFANAKTFHKKMPTLAYRIAEMTIDQDERTGESIVAPHIVWEKEAVSMTADQAVEKTRGKVKEKDEAVELLEKLLVDGGGSVKSTVVQEQAKEEGFTMKQMRTAKRKLGLKADKEGLGGWVWRTIL